MARGVRVRLSASVGVATTGIAGPDGGTPEKPVGLVWFALDDVDGRAVTVRLDLAGDRETIAGRATTVALGMLWRHLTGQDS